MPTRSAPIQSDAGTSDASEEVLSDAVWTIPNVISALRIVLIVVFTVLLATHHDAWAIAALAVAGISDFLDGYLARRWNQVTKLGRVLDPAADRILTVAVVIGLALRGIVPWWLVVILLMRDVVVGIALALGKRHGVHTPQVTFLGKLATLLLYFALPIAYLGYERWEIVHTCAIVLAVVAAALYWWAGIGYVADVRRRVRATPTAG